MALKIRTALAAISAIAFFASPAQTFESRLALKPLAPPAAAREVGRATRLLVRRPGGWGIPPPVSSRRETPPVGNPVLGVDYGLRRIGTATMAGFAPRRLLTVQHTGSDLEAARALVRLAQAEGATKIVVGLPLDKDGTETRQAILTRQFALLLASVAGPRRQVLLVDERYSSSFAAARMSGSKSKSRARDNLAALDEESACIILETYFNDAETKVERVGHDGGEARERAEEEERAEEARAEAELEMARELEADLGQAKAKRSSAGQLDAQGEAEGGGGVGKAELAAQRALFVDPQHFDLDLDADIQGEIARRAADLRD